MKKKVTLRYVLADNVLKIVHRKFLLFYVVHESQSLFTSPDRWKAHVTAESIASSSSSHGNIITFPGFHESHNGRLVFPRHIAKYT